MKLFTYGTLRTGQALEGYLPTTRRVNARAPGCLYDYGSYPVANLNRDAPGMVIGELVDLTYVRNADIEALMWMEVRAGYEVRHIHAYTRDEPEVGEPCIGFHFPDCIALPRIPGDDWTRVHELDPADRHQRGGTIASTGGSK